MKSIEIQVTFRARVADDVAAAIERDPQLFFMQIPLANVFLMMYKGVTPCEVPASVIDFVTTDIEVDY